jgi:hypothetical protein
MKGVRRITENVIETKSYNFAIDVINTYKKLQEDKEFILSKQFLRDKHRC